MSQNVGRRFGVLAAIAELAYAVAALCFVGSVLGLAMGFGIPIPGSRFVAVGSEAIAAVLFAAGLSGLRRWAWYGAVGLGLLVALPNIGYTLAVFQGIEGAHWARDLTTVLVVLQVILQALVIAFCLLGAFAARQRAA